jgi:adenylate kinase
VAACAAAEVEDVADGMKIVLVGPPGSGKGTQAGIVAGELGVPAISTGEMLRDAVAMGSDLGRRVEGIMKAGKLVDDETMADVVRARLARPDAGGGFILDGYPRTLPQAETLAGILEDAGEELDAVVLIEVPEQELVTRALARGRSDDTEETIRQRLREYREKTEPLAGYYEERGMLRTVDGHASIGEVTDRLREAIGVEAA